MHLKGFYKTLFVILILCCNRVAPGFSQKKNKVTKQIASMAENKKLVIYQMLPRLFGNKLTANVPYGTIKENGSGKFNDVNEQALDSIKGLGVNYIWYTGVIAHASLTDYSFYSIKPDDADVVKGRAGSPYAVRDYYDVDPDLAVDVKNRMAEFESLLNRTHGKGLKVIMDFIPNHVARTYHSMARPAGIKDFGADDDVSKSFSASNDFYYIPGKSLVVPSKQAEESNLLNSLKDGKFIENPAKATGNDVFNEHPSIDDWYETIKLNYGVDYGNGKKQFFNPRPPVWTKMKDILLFWARKGTDGFRCDMAEMVPVEFWNWVIPEVKKSFPNLIFIGEAYNPAVYKLYLTEGKFDYLYDKVGLYDGLKKLIRNEASADVNNIRKVWQEESAGFGDHMLRFLENHDEERIASAGFAGDAKYAIPGMVVSATLSGGPVMIYSGQEVGEPAKGKEGFGGDDNRTTIFDYWGIPEHQKWMNNGAFDGALLSPDQFSLRDFYKRLMQLSVASEAILKGRLVEIPASGNMNNRMYGYIRYTANQRVLILVNFDRENSLNTVVKIPHSILNRKPITLAKDILNNQTVKFDKTTIQADVKPASAQIIEF
jgi:glycosidase